MDKIIAGKYDTFGLKSIWLGALVGTVFLQAACGASGPAEQTTPICKGDPTAACRLTVSEPGFVQATVAVTDGVSTSVVSHTPGRFCMSGKLDPGATNMNWGALLGLALAPRAPTGVTGPFRAASRGIAQVRFRIDPAPVAGLTVGFSALQRADCLVLPDCLAAAAFFLMEEGSPSPTVIEDPGTVTVPLSAFHQPDWGDPSLPFDTDLISGLEFVPEVLPGVVLDYDFCVQDVTFIDAVGREVSP